ncbi:P-loop NTPase family protein [Geomonas azotofigens]|uniref:hypothetical protein n=1 Tax=Geomonas azotofigens TaxID=2843196 RepID=UPI001C0F5DF6|nr:hypothetical protein [Geomonas azotofigens]MBU5614635.1 hypothetical protein [Geomonas azotofigens]
MSNIFDALEQARRERHKDDPLLPDVGGVGSTPPNKAGADSVTDAEIVGMFARIQEGLNAGGWIMQLISSQAGEGVSSVTERFAKVSSELQNQNVLVVKLGDGPQTDRQLNSYSRWHEISENNEVPVRQPQSKGVLTEVRVLFEDCIKQLKKDPNLANRLKTHYDIVFFDSPSIEVEPHSVELTRYADVVVIVLESEKTKAFALQSLKEKITHNSDALLGVVLNKRCFHIPCGLYSKLH